MFFCFRGFIWCLESFFVFCSVLEWCCVVFDFSFCFFVLLDWLLWCFTALLLFDLFGCLAFWRFMDTFDV